MNKQFYSLLILLTIFIWNNNNIALSKESKINISQLKKQAKRGDAKAENALGDYYDSITRMPVNEGCFPYNRRQTIKYYTKAARQGYTKAQKSLGMLYTQLPCSEYDKGIYWLKKIAFKGDVEDQMRLGYVYYMTSNVIEKTIFWYEKAAKLNNATAMLELGRIYEKYDYDKAIYWYKKGMALGNAYSSFGLCNLYFISQDTPEEEIKRYKEKGLNKDNKKSDKYCLISANQGNAEAQFTVGAQYMTGRRVLKNEKKAMEYFKKSCLQKYDMGCDAYHGKMNFNDVTY
ncbi:tetratricopeptide repeat protein [Commensalibacter papalotli (ex Botero et al. 2024)]|uniref:Beta-lactamase n=1 Tax=Commensalibacter papalotli (ex Botero et al. 2024) TaxID=2972766 RepID=A0ABN8WJ73_9PROT|nr:tetratricopeptide repeat protein [Commensalibacter papalotli (ex Botero et al. 2024)]CAI3956065.1 unnamed protein product [Commensalibacter papalotli (ex Botero et al. 2024)]CAI3956231.1 unnamed protein product [Commensalibacter papalotli (ex Botero et al. 2024)]